VAFELDPCVVRAITGELLARGFVREHDGVTMLVEADHFTGVWLEPGDPAVVEVMSSHKGACTYNATVSFSAARRIGLVGLALQAVVQQRSALRVPTALPLRVTEVMENGVRVPLDEPLDVVVVDVSAHGMRLRSATEVEPGVQLVVTLEAGRTTLDLVAEVLRREEVRGGSAYGCRFLGLREREADELFRFVLEEQRRQLAQRRELGHT
jgi:c-di-GMP-binding flagellar brake protein YcgR